jgi:hypothetical protein
VVGADRANDAIHRILGATPALAFDGTTTPSTAALSPADGLRGSAHPPEGAPNKNSSLTALQYAADQGQPVAQWKLGRMYADGDGVPRDDLRAFNYFSQIANSHPDEAPGTPQARFVANAFVALGHYYLIGIPNSKITVDRARARDMFGYAATYFGDADAQYELGRLYLGASGDPHQAARWLRLAATKGHCRAEVALGEMLFQGQVVPRQAARGLMWLILGRDCAGALLGRTAGAGDQVCTPRRGIGRVPRRFAVDQPRARGHDPDAQPVRELNESMIPNRRRRVGRDDVTQQRAAFRIRNE